MPVLGQRILRRFHLSQTDAGAEAVGETFASEIVGGWTIYRTLELEVPQIVMYQY